MKNNKSGKKGFINISCRQASRLLSEQLDHPLSCLQWILLKIHLVTCTNCVFFGRQVKALKHLIGLRCACEDDLPLTPDASLSDEVQQKIKAALREDNS